MTPQPKTTLVCPFSGEPCRKDCTLFTTDGTCAFIGILGALKAIAQRP